MLVIEVNNFGSINFDCIEINIQNNLGNKTYLSGSIHITHQHVVDQNSYKIFD